MAKISTEQRLLYKMAAADGRGRPKPIDGAPVVTSSDETVIRLDPPAVQPDGSWTFYAIAAGVPGTATILATADVDISPSVQDIQASEDIEVTLDDRTAARTVTLVAGAPEDQP